jgi:hypothetical protein
LTEAEKTWLTESGASPGSVLTARAEASRIVTEIRASMPTRGATIGSLQVFALGTPAPALVLIVSRPAFFLPSPALADHPRDEKWHAYLRVVDTNRRLVIEFYSTGHGGGLFVRPGLASCSPVVAFGWPVDLPPCPA